MNHDLEEDAMDGTPFGRYRLLEVLGRGGMGEVWRAFDTGTERIVAVKVLPVHLAGDDGFQQRFLREAKAAASLNEPHVVPIYDFGQIADRLFVAMRLVDGHDLQDLLAHGPLTPDRAVALIEQVASALDAAHRIGLIHRDVKPSNILVTEDDFAYLIDFGIARVAGETGLTSTGMTLGTWPYMAPERFRTGTVDARADVYALTCVLHQALTGKQPFPGDSLEQIATGHMFEPPPLPSAIRPSVPAAMDNVVATGMAKDPDERYATTRDLAHAAQAALPAPISRATIAAAGAATLAAPAPALNDAPTEYAPTEAAPVRSTRPAAKAPKERLPRPAAVTAAVVVAGLLVALHAISGAVLLHEGFNYAGHPDYGDYGTMTLIVGVESLALAAFLVWSAVVAIRGTELRGLLFAPLVAAVFMVIAVFVGLALGGRAWEASGMLVYPLIFLPLGSFLITRRSSRDFFRGPADTSDESGGRPSTSPPGSDKSQAPSGGPIQFTTPIRDLWRSWQGKTIVAAAAVGSFIIGASLLSSGHSDSYNIGYQDGSEPKFLDELLDEHSMSPKEICEDSLDGRNDLALKGLGPQIDSGDYMQGCLDGIRDARKSAAGRSTSGTGQTPTTEADRQSVPTQPAPPPPDDEAYLQRLKAIGLTIKDRSAAIGMGHSVCAYLGDHTKQQTIDDTYNGQRERQDKPGKKNIASMVEASIAVYCPQYIGR